MRIVAWDLETSDLKALMGRIFCCSFLPIIDGVESKPYTFHLHEGRFKGASKIDDSRLCTAIRDELEKYNCIVGWNSKLFDLPLLNARLAKHGSRPVRPQFHADMMWYAGGSSMRIGSRKLVNVQKYFKLGEEKTDIDWEVWQAVATGDTKAMKIVVEHCEADVKVLAEAYWKLLPYVSTLHR
jgi:DNA polymerase elongation subunit (family B)